ncbi:MAG: DNA translocase FtsK [Bdellovibrionales bacterium]
MEENIYRNKIKADFLSVGYLAASGLTALSLFSYSPSDLSFHSNSYNWSEPTNNICGLLGSFLSDFLYQFLGLGAWGIVLFLFWMFWSGIREVKPSSEKIIFYFVGLFSICLTLGFFSKFYLYDDLIFAGGALGKGVFQALYPFISKGGIFIFVSITTFLTVLVFTEKTLAELSFSELLKWRPSFSKEESESVETEDVPIKKGPKLFRNELEIEDSILEPVEEEEGMPLFKMPKVERSSNKIDTKLPKVQSNSEEGDWELPELDLLEDVPEDEVSDIKDEEIQEKARLLVSKLEQFNVKGQITGIHTGPAVTLFEFKPNVNVKISKITELADDLSLALASESIRIIAPIPGRDVVGIESSNAARGTVYLKEILGTEDFWDEDVKIPIALGKRADGHPMVVDLRKMPHLLVAGSTGSGKSVFVVSTITSLLMRYSPEDLRLVMVDPKQVDLAAFEDLPHLILPVIKDPKKAISSLRWAIREMDKRYRSMAQFGARNLEGFNEIVEELTDEEYQECEEENEKFEEKKKKTKTYYFEKLPYIVIIVEEFGDLMAVDKSNVEAAVVRLAQMARACGIHLILAMQSPRRDVVTGLIKTNIPGRISFKVASKTDSRIILDEGGGERLLARGDMLFLAPGTPKPERAHGSWAPEDDISGVVEHWKDQGEPEYLAEFEESEDGESGSGMGHDSEDQLDDRYDEILNFVSTQKTVSASLLQRRFRLGYPRAARLIEDMESQGVVGPAQGSKPRKVLIEPFADTGV